MQAMFRFRVIERSRSMMVLELEDRLRVQRHRIVVRSAPGHAQGGQTGQVVGLHAPVLLGCGLSRTLQQAVDPRFQVRSVPDAEGFKQTVHAGDRRRIQFQNRSQQHGHGRAVGDAGPVKHHQFDLLLIHFKTPHCVSLLLFAVYCCLQSHYTPQMRATTSEKP